MSSSVSTGLVGTPSDIQLAKVLDVLDIYDCVTLVSGRVISRKLRSLIESYGFRLVVRKELSGVDSVWVFDDPDVNDLLNADRNSIPIYSSSSLLAA